MTDVDLPSRLQLAPGPWPDLLSGLCARFPAIPRQTWLQRFARGRVRDAGGRPLQPGDPWQVGLELVYFREVADEPVIPFAAQVLHHDADLLVADKPHFLPVVPSGAFVRQTLLARLVAATGNRDLVPLHRIDRATAGLVLFSCRRQTRAAYQALFRERAISKRYEALAAPSPGLVFPRERHSRLAAGEPFFRMREVDGAPNALTRISVLRAQGPCWHYRLEPVSGRKHQLRVHMAALGAPILGDTLYPVLREGGDDYGNPLRLLARELAFVDPLSGALRRFASLRQLTPPGAPATSGDGV